MGKETIAGYVYDVQRDAGGNIIVQSGADATPGPLFSAEQQALLSKDFSTWTLADIAHAAKLILGGS